MLRQKCEPINLDYPGLSALIGNLWETMYHANGCGLAAPQIGKPVRLFIVDSKTAYERYGMEERIQYFPPHDKGIEETFINARIIEQSEELWEDDEGCLSIPHLSHKVKRPWTITIEYNDRDFTARTKTFSGLTARMVQHEYDHTEGRLYLDYLQPLTKKMLEAKLRKISSGKLRAAYPMLFRNGNA